MATNNYILTHNYKRMMAEIESKTSHIEDLQKQIGKAKQLAKKAEAYDILAEEAQLENSIGEISIIGEFNKGVNAESLTGLLLDNKQTSKQILVKSLELKVVETQEVEETQQTQEEQTGGETQQTGEQQQTGEEPQTGEGEQETEEAKKIVQVKYSATITLSTEQKVLDKTGKVVGVIPATFELGETELSTLTADKINYLGDITLFGEKQQTQEQTTGGETQEQGGEAQQTPEQQTTGEEQTGGETQTATGLTFTSPTYSDSAEASEPKTATFTQTTANIKTYSTSPSFGELTQTSVSGSISLKTLYVDSTPVILPVLTLTADMLKATPIVGKVEEA